jgi:hypothetical protein
MAGTQINGRPMFIPRSDGIDYQTTVQVNKIVDDLEKLRASAGGLFGSATFDPANLVDGAGATTTVTVTGAVLGDFVTGVSFSNDLQGITVSAYVSSANTVSVRFQNESGGALDLASGTLRVRVSPFGSLTGAASDMTAAKLGNLSGTAFS